MNIIVLISEAVISIAINIGQSEGTRNEAQSLSNNKCNFSFNGEMESPFENHQLNTYRLDPTLPELISSYPI